MWIRVRAEFMAADEVTGVEKTIEIIEQQIQIPRGTGTAKWALILQACFNGLKRAIEKG